jgi:hypothetical protein
MAMMMMAMAVMTPVPTTAPHHLDIRQAFTNGLRRFQVVEDARPVRHSGERGGGLCRDDGGHACQPEHPGQK